MRFIVMHKTDARWEAGQRPSQELIANVGALIGDPAKAGAFKDGEGLRATSEGVRLAFAPDGERTVTRGPLTGENELPAGFSIIRAPSLDAAIDWATEEAADSRRDRGRRASCHRTVGHRDGGPTGDHVAPLHGAAQGHGRHRVRRRSRRRRSGRRCGD